MFTDDPRTIYAFDARNGGDPAGRRRRRNHHPDRDLQRRRRYVLASIGSSALHVGLRFGPVSSELVALKLGRSPRPETPGSGSAASRYVAGSAPLRGALRSTRRRQCSFAQRPVASRWSVHWAGATERGLGVRVFSGYRACAVSRLGGGATPRPRWRTVIGALVLRVYWLDEPSRHRRLREMTWATAALEARRP